MNCKNCEHTVNGNFCSFCGQKSSVSRITFSNFITEVSESLFQVNKGFFFTLKELYIRPGYSIQEFLKGKRQHYFKPIAYTLTLTTLYFLISQLTNQATWLEDLISGWMNGASGGKSIDQVPVILIWLSTNYAYSTLLLVPIFSISSYLSFLKFGTNYAEHLVLNFYISGQQATIYALFAIAGLFIESELLDIFPVLVSISYASWVLVQFYSAEKLFIKIFRLFLTYILYLMFSTCLLFILIWIYEF